MAVTTLCLAPEPGSLVWKVRDGIYPRKVIEDNDDSVSVYAKYWNGSLHDSHEEINYDSEHDSEDYVDDYYPLEEEEYWEDSDEEEYYEEEYWEESEEEEYYDEEYQY